MIDPSGKNDLGAVLEPAAVLDLANASPLLPLFFDFHTAVLQLSSNACSASAYW